MQNNQDIQIIVSLIQKGKRASAKVLKKIILTEGQIAFCEDIKPIEYCFMIAHDYKSRPKCLVCGSKTSFETVFKGFKKYCSIKCATKINNNSENNKIKVKNLKTKLDARYHQSILDATNEYCSNDIYTVKEVEEKYNIPGGRLRKNLRINGLIHKKTKGQNFKNKSDKRLFSKEYFEDCIKNKHTLKFTAKDLNVAANTVRIYALNHDIKFPGSSSTCELEIKAFVESLGLNTILHDRKALYNINNYYKKIPEIDIFIPEKTFGIEFNGSYWHSKLSKNSHLNKQIVAENSGVNLIQITDYEWFYSENKIKSIIKSKLGVNNNIIGARECTVHKLKASDANKFFDENHLQSASRTTIAYGLYNKDKLISCMSFSKPRFNKKYDYELIRFANTLDTTVLGGFQRLLKTFRNEYKGSIISYANRRLFNGEIYKSAGFKELHTTPPGYIWINHDLNIISRYKTQKHKLIKNIGENISHLSEPEIMENLGYSKLWDCGQKVFILE